MADDDAPLEHVGHAALHVLEAGRTHQVGGADAAEARAVVCDAFPLRHMLVQQHIARAVHHAHPAWGQGERTIVVTRCFCQKRPGGSAGEYAIEKLALADLRILPIA